MHTEVASPSPRQPQTSATRPSIRVLAFVSAVLGPVLVLWLRLEFDPYFEGRPLLILFVTPIILASALGGLRTGLLATLLSALLSNFYLLPPAGAFSIDTSQFTLHWGALVFNGILISLLSERLHRLRRRAEDASVLRAQLNHIAETLPGALYLFRRDVDGRTTFPYSSQAFADLMGLVSGEDLHDASRTFARTHPDDLPALLASVEASARTLTRWSGTFRLRHPQRGEIWIEAFSVPERQPDGSILWSGFAHDITERKRREEQAREHEEKWRFALEGSGDGVWDWDAETNEVHFSRQWKAMLGYAEDEIRNALVEWESRVHPDDYARVMADVQRHFAGETPLYVNEHRVRCKDGTYKWILDRGMLFSRTPDGRPKRVVGTHTDISARKQVELELSQQVDELRRWHEVTLGREERIMALKREVNELAARLGQPPRYSETGAGPELPS